MKWNNCPECGGKLTKKEDGNEGMVPFCPACNAFRYPMYNVAVSMITVNETTGDIILIKQYGRDAYILVAGYVSRGESCEDAAKREIKEETGMTVSKLKFNKTKFFEPSNTLMCNFTAYVKDDSELSPNEEIDSYKWFSPDEAAKNIKPGSLAEEFLLYYLDTRHHM